MVELERIGPDNDSDPAEPGRPQQRAAGVDDAGMGDMLLYDSERLRILIERHRLCTGSKRATELLENWEETRARFIKVMPKDYRRALLDMKNEEQGAKSAAE